MSSTSETAMNETPPTPSDAPLTTSTPKTSSAVLPPIHALPRAGGFIKGLPSSSNVVSSRSSKSMNQTKSHTSMSVFYAKSRERRINLVLEESEWNLGGSQLDVSDPDTLADNMLAVAISCVMLMAADVDDIPEEYFTFAENYLSCIKDDTGYHPPNVQANLTMIEDVNKNASTISERPPVVITKLEKYKPTLYTFRIPSNNISSASRHSLVKCPPFYVQLDHTLAVIWSLFSAQPIEKPLGLVQLQWALNFLQGVRNSKGKHPKDVAVCIETMEEALIEEYAAMADTVKPSTTSNKIKTSSVSSVKKSSGMLPDLGEKKLEMDLITRKFPFSVTYAEMSKKRPNRVEQLFKAKGGVSMTGADIQRQLDNLKNMNSEITLGAACSREDMVEFLKGWRKEQINKLQEELQRLHSIETFIGTLDKENFKPYLENEQVDALVAQKAKNGESLLYVKKNSERRSSSRT